MEIVFKEFRDRFLMFFVDALGAVFLIFQALKASLKTNLFFMKKRISRLGSGGADPGVFGPSKDIKA